MAFQAPNLGQGRANRKLLEELEEQKRRLQNQNSSGPSVPPAVSTSAVTTPSSLNQDTQHMTAAQRAAIQHAHANSVGYFITQDSSFGNLILPVLPRFDK